MSLRLYTLHFFSMVFILYFIYLFYFFNCLQSKESVNVFLVMLILLQLLMTCKKKNEVLSEDFLCYIMLLINLFYFIFYQCRCISILFS